MISDWVWETGRDGSLTFVSDRIIESLSRHPVQLVGLQISDIGRFVDASGHEQAPPDLKKPFRNAHFEAIGADGVAHKFLISALPRFDQVTGQFAGTMGTAKDVTDLHRVERANARLADAIDVLQGLFALYDEDDKFVISNARFRVFNRQFANLTVPGSDFVALLQSEVEAGRYPATTDATAWIEARLSRRRAPSGPFELNLADGSWLLIDEQRIPDGGTVTIASDITDLKKAMSALQASANQHREFASDVAHRLRTPIAVLRSSLDGLGDTETATALKREVDGLTRMIEQLLTLTRYERLRPEPGALADLHAIAVETISNLAPMAIRDGRGLELDGATGSVLVNGDSGAIVHAVRNLIENAVAHSRRGAVVRVVVDADPPAIHVIDQGGGISPEARPGLFAKFNQIDRRSFGTGLGLHIVNCVVENHGAVVAVDGALGGGTVFSITFPSSAGTLAASCGY
ncbi:MAG: PAS domain-containing sensor histidine kinase [Proteobacteria bacterium]|nr:PAS domain-containing sensor histidine kinase [Pseudomonadota bacterium]